MKANPVHPDGVGKDINFPAIAPGSAMFSTILPFANHPRPSTCEIQLFNVIVKSQLEQFNLLFLRAGVYSKKTKEDNMRMKETKQQILSDRFSCCFVCSSPVCLEHSTESVSLE